MFLILPALIAINVKYFSMKVSKILFSLLSVFFILFISCNDAEDEDVPLYSSYSNTMVKSFYLSDDTTSIVDNLSKRFFTIDLVSGNIYNADSFTLRDGTFPIWSQIWSFHLLQKLKYI